MANWLNPLITSTYTDFVAEVRGRDEDVARGFDPAFVTLSNQPTNAIRYSSAVNRWERWNGTAWVALSTGYAISITGNAATVTNGVYTTGDQTIGGIKTFTGQIVANGGVQGNAATATALQTARTINGVSFNGSANITLPTVNTTGDQTIGGTKTFSSIPVAPGLNLTGANGGGNGVYDGNGDAASSTQANLQIRSWFGIGFSPSISGQPVPQNENAVWIDVRTGNLSARGNITSTGGQFLGNGAGLTNLNASNLASGTVPVARLGSGTADNTTFLRGDNTWQTITPSTAAVLNATAGAEAGGVGTYAFMRGPTSISAGTTVSGSSLVFAHAAGGAIGSVAGTWRCMGITGSTSGSTATTLWLRIS